MGVVVPAIGSAAWGQPLNDAISNVAHRAFDAVDLDFKLWNYDHWFIGVMTANNLTSGTVRMVRLPRLTQTQTLTGVGFCIGSATVTPTAGQCFAALYDSSGTRLAVSADISASLGVTGVIKFPFTGTYVAAAGDYYSALLINAATPSTLGMAESMGNSSVVNGALPVSVARVTNGPAAQTSMPASIVVASRTASQHPTWSGAY